MTAKKTRTEDTGKHVLDVALAMFRARGFEATTMRDIAREAGLSLGAAYYYYRSKDAIVLAYYAERLRLHEARARAAFGRTEDLRERLAAVLDIKLELLAPDRRLLGALFRAVGDPESDVSLFSKETAKTREGSVALYEEALRPAALPDEPRRVAALALWAAHLGIVLYFLHDDSPRQARTRRLAEDVVNLVASAMPFVATPMGAALLTSIQDVLGRAGIGELARAQPTQPTQPTRPAEPKANAKTNATKKGAKG